MKDCEKSNHTSEVKYHIDTIIPQLIGMTIVGPAVDGSGEFYGFICEKVIGGKKLKKVVFVLSDAEGNGAGWLEVNNG